MDTDEITCDAENLGLTEEIAIALLEIKEIREGSLPGLSLEDI